MSLQDQFSTSRLRLRKIAEEDYVKIFSCYASCPDATQYLNWPINKQPAETLSYCKSEQSRWDLVRDFTYSVFLPGRSEVGTGDGDKQRHFVGESLVGVLRLSKFRSDTPFHFELGFCLGKAFWGKGYATEMVSALISHAWGESYIKRLTAFSHPDNQRSIRVLKKNGFEEEGRLKRAGLFPNISPDLLDILVYGLVR